MNLVQKYGLVLRELASLFLLLLVFVFVKSELLIFFSLIILIFLSFKLDYYKNEWKVLFFGIITGFLFEIAGDYIFKLQSWDQATLFGIPLWLPLMWGYGFVFIRRIGNLMIK